ncbi:MAG TPA: FAD-binding protein [bacterium]|nr:FAD-binding protein [bacterium]
MVVGGAGLFAALELGRAGAKAAVISKLHPVRSHTGGDPTASGSARFIPPRPRGTTGSTIAARR